MISAISAESSHRVDGLDIFSRTYGWPHFLNAESQIDGCENEGLWVVEYDCLVDAERVFRHAETGGTVVWMYPSPDVAKEAGISCKFHQEPALLSVERRINHSSRIQLRTCLKYCTYEGDGLSPYCINSEGLAAIVRQSFGNGEIVWVGVQIIDEVVFSRQGNPHESRETGPLWGFEGERPNYLFENQLVAGQREVPWADLWGKLWAELLAELTDFPLFWPLPGGATGLVVLTGDDDQAYLEKYARQLELIESTPITYFLVTETRHTAETLKEMPLNVDLGLHVDALSDPESYSRLCRDQTMQLREMTSNHLRTIRNHGYLNDGYWGHLKAWEHEGIELDLNLPGVDGTALNGSFLPMRVRRRDGTWSSHYSLLTAFGDGMQQALGWTGKQAASQIDRVARQIESRYPGALVFNFHPQNVDSCLEIHEAALRLAKQRGWRSIGIETYLDWLKVMASIRTELNSDGCQLISNLPVTDLAISYKGRIRKLDTWSGKLRIPH